MTTTTKTRAAFAAAAMTLLFTAGALPAASAKGDNPGPGRGRLVPTVVTMAQPTYSSSPRIPSMCNPFFNGCQTLPLQYDYYMTLRGRLTTNDGQPVVGRPLAMTVDSGAGCTGLTGDDGWAACTMGSQGTRSVTGAFAGDDVYAASSGTLTW